MDLRTVEVAYDQVIELSQSSIVLHESEDDKETLLPSSFPFALPLTSDTPQCIHTAQSSLRHVLSATLHPFDDTAQPFSKELTVHTRRFISHTRSIPISPVTRTLDNPSRVEVEIPRAVFTCVEPVPIYVTVPPPSRELVVEGGLRLRNIKAELIRIVRVADGAETDEGESVDVDIPADIDDESEEEGDHGASAPLGISLPSHEKDAAALSRSGALCRFHASLPVRLRFILHQSSPSSSPSDSIHPFRLETLTTLLHSVSFRIRVHATFRNTSHHTERSVSSAYHKKHDRPPARTNRPDETDAAPHYEGEAGPSYLASGLPPPFEERDAPPPFFPSSMFIANADDDAAAPPTLVPPGILFGFSASSQFSGHSDVDMATLDPDVTGLVRLNVDTLGLTLHQQEEITAGEAPPPPPPPMDDPSDPPPSIHSEYRSREGVAHQATTIAVPPADRPARK
ncbi:hypothetical protein EI94DRAFT_1716954 [Lactarius quietus]|nr:hypothetical protein EI94DRAFT_1716954 [Lactarius quietus]